MSTRGYTTVSNLACSRSGKAGGLFLKGEESVCVVSHRWNFQREDFKNQAPKDGKYVAHVSMMLRHGGSQSLPFPLEIEIDNSGILIHLSSAAVSEPPASVAEVLVDF